MRMLLSLLRTLNTFSQLIRFAGFALMLMTSTLDFLLLNYLNKGIKTINSVFSSSLFYN